MECSWSREFYMKNSKAKQATRLAYRRGYRVSPSGEVVSPTGTIRKLNLSHNKERGYAHRYWQFTIRNGEGKTNTILVHKLVAYQKFGEAAYMSAECVRHLNGNPQDNRFDNIEIGTLKENSMDISKEGRRAMTAKAVAASRRKDWDLIDADRSEGMVYTSLAPKYGVSLSCLGKRYSKNGKRPTARACNRRAHFRVLKHERYKRASDGGPRIIQVEETADQGDAMKDKFVRDNK